jgi:glycine dehydrogenase subunit 1
LDKNILLTSFLGGGMKPHYIPAAVRAIVSRSEFYTSYTPYQAEFSQGILQSMFEYQSMMGELTGMDVANMSMYDSSTALGEAALMACRITKKNEMLIPSNISWEKKSVLRNYVKGIGMKIEEIPYLSNGKVDLDKIKKKGEKKVVYIENPNFFGLFEDRISEVREISEESFLIMGIDPISLAIVTPPSEYGADVVVGEGRSLGNPLNFGGPLNGILACKKEFVRQLPGRIIGATTDKNGKRAFCMVLQTREQHIRRGKATSNICTNNALCSLASAVYMALLGEEGLREIAVANMRNGEKLMEKISSINGFELPFDGEHFNEFVALSPIDPDELNKKLLKRGIQGGLPLKPLKSFPELEKAMLFGVTEMHTDEEMERLVNAIEEVL